MQLNQMRLPSDREIADGFAMLGLEKDDDRERLQQVLDEADSQGQAVQIRVIRSNGSVPVMLPGGIYA